MISFEHIELGPGAVPGYVFWWAAANSPVKSPEILNGAVVCVLHQSDTSFDMS